MNLLISIVSWLLAAGGFLVSVTASILTALIPRLQAKVPEEVHARYRIRIPPRASGEFGEQQKHLESTLPSTTHATPGRSNSGSADSLPSFDTTHSDRASSTTPTRRTTSTPPTSLPNSPEYRLRSLPHTDSTLTKSDSGSKTNVFGHLAHVCTQRCSNHASTSASAGAAGALGTSSSFERETGRYESDMNSSANLDSRKKKKAKRMVSWLKTTTSPPSPIRTQAQRTPRSSEDSSRGPPVPSTPPHSQEMSMNERPATFTDDVLLRGSGKPGRKEPRRASTLLPLMRFGIGKSSNRYDAFALPAPMLSPTSHMSTVPENMSEGGEVREERKSAPSTPAHVSRDLLDVGLDVDLERSMREMKRKSSYFGRLKRKSSEKEAYALRLSPPLEDRSLDASSPTQTQFLHSSPDRRDASPPSPPPSPSPPAPAHVPTPKKKRSICEKHRRSRPVSAPGTSAGPGPTPTSTSTSAPAHAAPRRTNPYDAPYYFPTPVSPEAVDYVRRARTEIRRSSVSPSAKGRKRRRERGRERDGGSPENLDVSGELLKSPTSPTSPSPSSSPIVQRAKSTDAHPHPHPHSHTSTGTNTVAHTHILQSAAPQQGSIVLSSSGATRHRKTASASVSASGAGTGATMATAIRVDDFGFVHPVTVSLREKKRE